MPQSDSTPPGGHRSTSWWDRELGKKADVMWVEAELKVRDQATGQAKSIAVEAKKKAEGPHVCLHEEDFTYMKEALSSLRNWKVGGLAGVIVLIVAAVANYVALNGTVEITKSQVTEVKDAQRQMQVEVTTKIDSLKVKIDESDKERRVRDAQQQEDLKKVLKDAMQETRLEMRPRRTNN